MGETQTQSVYPSDADFEKIWAILKESAETRKEVDRILKETDRMQKENAKAQKENA